MTSMTISTQVVSLLPNVQIPMCVSQNSKQLEVVNGYNKQLEVDNEYTKHLVEENHILKERLICVSFIYYFMILISFLD